MSKDRPIRLEDLSEEASRAYWYACRRYSREEALKRAVLRETVARVRAHYKGTADSWSQESIVYAVNHNLTLTPSREDALKNVRTIAQLEALQRRLDSYFFMPINREEFAVQLQAAAQEGRAGDPVDRTIKQYGNTIRELLEGLKVKDINFGRYYDKESGTTIEAEYIKGQGVRNISFDDACRLEKELKITTDDRELRLVRPSDFFSQK